MEELEGRIKRNLECDIRTEGKIVHAERLVGGGKCPVIACRWESGRQDIARYTSNYLTALKITKLGSLLAHTTCLPKIRQVKYYRDLSGWIILEEKLEGVRLETLPPDVKTVTGVARALAQLHQITFPRWTPLNYLFRIGSYHTYCYTQWIHKRLENWFSWTPDLNRATRNEYRAWFRRFRPAVNRISRFNLLHWDMNPNNCLYRDGQVQLVDFEFWRFGVFWEDYFMAEFHLVGEDPELCRAYRKCYFEYFSDSEMALKQETEDFFRAFIYLRGLSHLNRCFRRGEDVQAMEKYARYERRLRELVENH